MKLLLLFFLFPFFSNAQKVEQYARVTIENRLFSSSKKELFVNVGGRYLAIRDSLGKKIIFEDEIDALNYLGRMGWKLIQEVNTTAHDRLIQSFLFKKEMDLQEVASQFSKRNKPTDQ